MDELTRQGDHGTGLRGPLGATDPMSGFRKRFIPRCVWRPLTLVILATGCLAPERPLAGHAIAFLGPAPESSGELPAWVGPALRAQLLEELEARGPFDRVAVAEEPTSEALWIGIQDLSFREPLDTAFTLDRGLGRREGLLATLTVWDPAQRTVLLKQEATATGTGAWPEAPTLAESRLRRMIEEVVDEWVRAIVEAYGSRD